MAHEIGDQPAAIGGVHHFGVELGAVIFAFIIGNHRKGCAVGHCDNAETGGKPGNLVAMAHPHLVAFAHLPQTVEQHARLGHGQERAAEFARIAGLDHAAQLLAHHLLAITDAQDRQSAVKQRLGRARAAVFGHTGRRSRQDDPGGLHPGKGSLGLGVWGDLGIDPGFAHAARDQLGYLAAEIDNEDGFAGRCAHVRRIERRTGPVQCVNLVYQLHYLQSDRRDAHLRYTLFGVLAASFSLLRAFTPCRRTELGESLESASNFGGLHAQYRFNRAADHPRRWHQRPDVYRHARLSVWPQGPG